MSTRGESLKEVRDVKLGIKDGDVVVTATVDMKSPDDRDDLYFVMFNILDDPLRLVVAVASNFADFLVSQGYRANDIESWLANDIQQYLKVVVKHQADIMANATERIRIPLATQQNADQARLVVTTMLAKGYFKQVTIYNIPGASEPDIKIQDVPTKDMSRDLNIMLEVIKNWENFDYETFHKEMVARYG